MNRERLLEKIKHMATADEKNSPVVGLDDFFLENTQEDSIAPNQVGYGRPSLPELYRIFSEIRSSPNVSDVLVSIHDDWVDVVDHPDAWPDGDSIHIFTSASASEVESWIVGLESDGTIIGWPNGEHKWAPKPPAGYSVFTVVWD